MATADRWPLRSWRDVNVAEEDLRPEPRRMLRWWEAGHTFLQISAYCTVVQFLWILWLLLFVVESPLGWNPAVDALPETGLAATIFAFGGAGIALTGWSVRREPRVYRWRPHRTTAETLTLAGIVFAAIFVVLVVAAHGS